MKGLLGELSLESSLAQETMAATAVNTALGTGGVQGWLQHDGARMLLQNTVLHTAKMEGGLLLTSWPGCANWRASVPNTAFLG